MTALDLPAIAARADAANAAVRRAEAVPRAFHNSVSVIGPVLLAVAPSAADVPALLAEVERLTALVHAKGSWIDGAKVDMAALEEAAAKATTWHMEALDDLAACVAERDEARAALASQAETVAAVRALCDEADEAHERYLAGVILDRFIVPAHVTTKALRRALDEHRDTEPQPSEIGVDGWVERIKASLDRDTEQEET